MHLTHFSLTHTCHYVWAVCCFFILETRTLQIDDLKIFSPAHWVFSFSHCFILLLQRSLNTIWGISPPPCQLKKKRAITMQSGIRMNCNVISPSFTNTNFLITHALHPCYDFCVGRWPGHCTWFSPGNGSSGSVIEESPNPKWKG